MKNHNATSVESSIISRIIGGGRGRVFVSKDFIDLGSRGAVDLALHRLARRGVIRRLSRGLYDYPEINAVLGAVAPSIENVAKALARNEKVKLQPSGAYAANLLGLSEQVPAKVVFLTNGRARKVKIGSLTIELRSTTPRKSAAAGRISGLVFTALAYLGKEHVTPERIAHLKRLLSQEDRNRLLADMALAPAWLHPHIRAISAADSP